jgi:hypothetical protein
MDGVILGLMQNTLDRGIFEFSAEEIIEHFVFDLVERALGHFNWQGYDEFAA